jgi:hypothetical protein
MNTRLMKASPSHGGGDFVKEENFIVLVFCGVS